MNRVMSILLLGILLAILPRLHAAPPTSAPARGSTTQKAPPAEKGIGSSLAAKTAKYTAPTPAQIKMMEEFTEEERTKTERELKIKLATIETTHFRILTDWDPREYTFLKDNFEAAYTAVTAQFGIPASENIFVGKLPCFVFVTYGNFDKFSKRFKIKVSPGVQAYYSGSDEGYGFMAVHKPQAEYSGRELDQMMKLWKYVVTHEMTHAFVARYISNRNVVTWLNEGIAEVIASGRFPRDIQGEARAAAQRYVSLDKLFVDDNEFRSADLYPVMRTLTEVLVKKDKKAFLKMFDDIKRGKSAEDALKDNYNMTYRQLEGLWRRYIGQ